MKIVVLDGYTLNPGDLSWDEFKGLGDFEVYDRTPESLIADRIGSSEIVITNKTPINKDIMDKCPNIKYIGVLATGYNVIDVDEAKSKGIVVTNIPTYGTDSVAQYVFALLLGLCHHVEAHSKSVHSGDWTKSEDFCYWNHPLIELSGKTMGIIGFGRIGKRTAQIAVAFGMNVLVYDRSPEFNLESYNLKFVTIDTLYEKSDVISLHVPLFSTTEGMICKPSIDKMKDGVMIINTSRGPLINESDLADALKSGKVKAAAVDVVSSEPIKEDNPLLNAPNIIITPHIAWAPLEARKRLMTIAQDNLKAFIDGNPINAVNP